MTGCSWIEAVAANDHTTADVESIHILYQPRALAAFLITPWDLIGDSCVPCRLT